MKVARSNSNPEIIEKLSDLDLRGRQSCDPIPEEETATKLSAFNQVRNLNKLKSFLFGRINKQCPRLLVGKIF